MKVIISFTYCDAFVSFPTKLLLCDEISGNIYLKMYWSLKLILLMHIHDGCFLLMAEGEDEDEDENPSLLSVVLGFHKRC